VSVSRRILSIAIIVAAVLPLVPAAARVTDDPALYVTFHPGPQRITVTLANGTPVGTSSGAPTVIPPGLYNLFFDDSAGVTGPDFRMKGPGVDVAEDMFYGEYPSATLTATFQASSTYTWRNNEGPSVVFTFLTSAGAGSSGTGSTSGSTGSGSTGSKTGKASTDIVGSAVIPFRGALDATVYKSGKLALNRTGKAVSTLKQGRYTFSVDDESKTAGFTLKSLRGNPVTITSKAFVGAHNVTRTLKQGRWFFYSPGGKQHQFIVFS
jgi:hypothetical protein